MADESNTSVRIIGMLEDECPACDRSGITDSLRVKCSSCDLWYHSVCVGVDESVARKGFTCARCAKPKSPTPSQAGRSSITGAFQARIEIEMLRIEEEKLVQERLLQEMEEHEKALREASIQKELEIKRIMNQQRWELERQFIGKKYNLLQSVNEEEDNVSEGSVRSNRSSTSTVHRWLEDQRKAIATACAGIMDVPVATPSYTGTIPRTSAKSVITSNSPATLVGPNIPPRQAQVMHADGTSLHDVAVGGSKAPVSSHPFEAVVASVPVSTIATYPTTVPKPIPHVAISDLISPPTSGQQQLTKTFNKISSDAMMTQMKLERQIHDLQKRMDDLQRQAANQLPSRQGRNSLSSQPPAVISNSPDGRVPWEGRSSQPGSVSVSANQMPLPRSQQSSLNFVPDAISQNPCHSANSIMTTVPLSAPFSVPPQPARVTTAPSLPNPIPSPWVLPGLPGVQPNLPAYGPNAQQLAARHVVPKELPHFDGNPLDWPLFFSSYTNSTQMCGYTDAENLMRLQRCSKGSALDAVSYQLLHPSSVPQVLETLRTLYGRPELVVNSLLSKVRSTPAPRADKLESIISFGLVVQNLCGHLRSLGMENHLSNPTLLQESVSKLPAGVKLDWALHQHRNPVVDLRTFGEFMSTIVSAVSNVTFHCDFEAARSIAPAKQDIPKRKEKGFLNTHADDGDKARMQDDRKDDDNEDDGDQLRVQDDRKGDDNAAVKDSVQPKPCLVCQRIGHKVKECYRFQKSSIEERWKLVHQLHLCQRCLASHGRWPCKAPLCGLNGCELKHHSLLHPDNLDTATDESPSKSTAKVNVHRQASQTTLFRIVPVRLYGKDSSIEVLALLDDGSSFTLMEQGVADQLGIGGAIEPLCLQWTNNVTRTESASKVLQLEISGARSDKHYVLDRVRTVENLGLPPQSLSFEQMKKRFPYLRGLPVSSYSEAVPCILIGLDNTDLMVTLKKRIGSPYEPVATKTKLGWTVYGCVEGLDNPPENRLLHVCYKSVDRGPHESVEEFFTVESTGVKVAPAVEADDDRRAREIMEKTTVHSASERFETGLLWHDIHDGDNYLDSRDTKEIRIASEVKQVHSKAGFELRNWSPNSVGVVRRVGESFANDCRSFSTDKTTEIERVFSVQWQPSTDEFTNKLCLRDDVAQLLEGDAIPTKREVRGKLNVAVETVFRWIPQAEDLVIHIDEATRNNRIRGKVVKTYSGKNVGIRSVDVQTSKGVFRRPVTKLAVLDVLSGGIADGSLQQYGSGDVGNGPQLVATPLVDP